MNDGEKIVDELINELNVLAKNNHKMTVEEAQEILDDFARVFIYLNESELFPLPVNPESLLPRTKNKIRYAFAVALNHAEDENRRYVLYDMYINLMTSFKPDKEADSLNMTLILDTKH